MLLHPLESRFAMFEVERAHPGSHRIGDPAPGVIMEGADHCVDIGALRLGMVGPKQFPVGGQGETPVTIAVEKAVGGQRLQDPRSEEHTSELQSLMRISYAVFCLKKKKKKK